MRREGIVEMTAREAAKDFRAERWLEKDVAGHDSRGFGGEFLVFPHALKVASVAGSGTSTAVRKA